MQPARLLRRFINRSSQEVWVAILRFSLIVVGLVLGTLTYESIMKYPSYRSNFLFLVSSLQQPHYLPTLIPLLLIPLVPILRGHLRWIFVACLIPGIYFSSIQRQDLKIFHNSHRIKFQPTPKIAHLLRSEEDPYLKRCVAPFFDMRMYLQGATLILPKDTPADLDGFRLFSLALVEKVERTPLHGEITREELDAFAKRPGTRYFQYTGLTDKDRRYMFMPPTPSKTYRVYTSDNNLVFAEEGYVIKQSD